jgi:hypothetical protein
MPQPTHVLHWLPERDGTGSWNLETREAFQRNEVPRITVGWDGLTATAPVISLTMVVSDHLGYPVRLQRDEQEIRPRTPNGSGEWVTVPVYWVYPAGGYSAKTAGTKVLAGAVA